MPQLEIRTNLRLSQIPADFNQKTTKLIAELLDKPADMVMVSLITNQLVTFGGTTEPCALVTLNSIGNVTPDENRANCIRMHSHFQNELCLSPKRVFIIFHDVNRNDLAWDSLIFDDILPKD